MIKGVIRGILRRTGFDIVRYRPGCEHVAIRDLTEREIQIVKAVRSFTLTSEERIATLLNAVEYIVEREIPGHVAECGVWRGGSMMAVALALIHHGDLSRDLYLYDTFEGMPEPTKHDRSFDGLSAQSQLEQVPVGTGIWCRTPIEDVRANLLSTGYPEEKLHLIRGRVEETLPSIRPEHLSILRLDTDWYVSTKHELIHLFPHLDLRGLPVVENYGHWQGTRKAVDEYFSESRIDFYLHRVDYTCRVGVRTASISTDLAGSVS